MDTAAWQGSPSHAPASATTSDLLLCRSSAIVIRPGNFRATASLIHWSRVADGTRHLAGVRVDALERARRSGQQEPVVITDVSPGHIDVPVAVLLSLHGVCGAVPVVERADDGHALRVGRPHAEGDPVRMRNRSHARDLGRITHGSSLDRVAATVVEPGTELVAARG